MKALPILAAALFLANGWAQEIRLDSYEGPGAAECFEQILKQRTLEYDSRRGLTGGVDNTDWGETSAVLVRLTFTAADAPPAVEQLYAAGNRKLVPLVEARVAQYRLSCLPPGHSKVVATQRFVMYGLDAKVLQLKRELTLVDVLRLAPAAKDKPVRFDFNTMACPFQLEFAPYQPYAINTVREVADRNPARREFIRWLQDITLDLPPQFMRTAMGSRSLVTVPCTVLDLS
jgi:hypothetical protein